jgi:uncharacterized membrane protein
MKRQIRIFMAGVLVVVPVAVTIYVAWWIGGLLGRLGEAVLELTGLIEATSGGEGEAPHWARWAGAGACLVAVYFIGLLTKLWVFRGLFRHLDRMLSRLPGVKTVYEYVRDLLKLFGGDAEHMGYPVLYTPPDSQTRMLGIVTNENPAGRADGDDSVIVYLPLGYMIGGPIIYAHPNTLERVDMKVETALKLAATAFVGATQTPDGRMLPHAQQPGAEKEDAAPSR